MIREAKRKIPDHGNVSVLELTFEFRTRVGSRELCLRVRRLEIIFELWLWRGLFVERAHYCLFVSVDEDGDG